MQETFYSHFLTEYMVWIFKEPPQWGDSTIYQKHMFMKY